MKKFLPPAIGIAIAVLAAGLSSCTSTFPKDLAAVSISKVSRADVTRLIGEDVHLPFFYDEKEFLVVRLTTREDVVAYAAKRQSTLRALGWLCADERRIRTAPSLYVHGREAYEGGEVKAMQPTSVGSFEFDTLHLLAWTEKDGTLPEYDLRGTPQDICLQVAGMNMAFSFESNVVRITAKQIQAVIDQ